MTETYKDYDDEMMERAEFLADEHWGYVEQILYNHGVDEKEVERIGFHFKSAMIHGYKHGRLEEQENNDKVYYERDRPPWNIPAVYGPAKTNDKFDPIFGVPMYGYNEKEEGC